MTPRSPHLSPQSGTGYGTELRSVRGSPAVPSWDRSGDRSSLTGLRPSPTRRAVFTLWLLGLRSGRMTRDGWAGRVYDCPVAVVGRGGRLIPNRSPS